MKSDQTKRSTLSPIKALFVTIGGVLLDNGWDQHARNWAVRHFKLIGSKMALRHHQIFDTDEEGHLTLIACLCRVVFHQTRSFAWAAFRRFMFVQSQTCPAMIEPAPKLKAKYGLKVVVVSNEGRELNAYRIRKFTPADIVKAFISFCDAQLRKSNVAIFRLVLGVAQTSARQVDDIEYTPMFVQITESLRSRS